MENVFRFLNTTIEMGGISFLILGKSAVGKTTLSCKIVSELAKNRKVLFFSEEYNRSIKRKMGKLDSLSDYFFRNNVSLHTIHGFLKKEYLEQINLHKYDVIYIDCLIDKDLTSDLIEFSEFNYKLFFQTKNPINSLFDSDTLNKQHIFDVCLTLNKKENKVNSFLKKIFNFLPIKTTYQELFILKNKVGGNNYKLIY